MQHNGYVPGATRAQSETFGVVLLLGIAVIGAVTVAVTGFSALEQDREQVGIEQAERSFSQFDSRTSEVALGRSEGVRVAFGLPDNGATSVRPDAGWMRVQLDDGSPGLVANETLGSVVFQQQTKTVGYQSGGVFRSSENRSVTISRPEFHYRNGTLTVPIIRTQGGAAVAGTVQATSNGTDRKFPDASRGLTNKVDETTVTVTVKSRYYEAWGEFFRSETPGTVTVDHSSRTARVRFEPATQVEFLHVTVHRLDVDGG